MIFIAFYAFAFAGTQSDGSDFIEIGTQWLVEPVYGITEDFETVDGDVVFTARQSDDAVLSDYLSIYREKTDGTEKLQCYILCHDDKVYVKQTPTSEQYLLYDFSLNAGDITSVGLCNGYGRVLREMDVKCVDVSYVDICGYQYKELTLEVYRENAPEEYVPTRFKWIEGIGSDYGLLNNAPGEFPCALQAVKHDGQTVYRPYRELQSLGYITGGTEWYTNGYGAYGEEIVRLEGCEMIDNMEYYKIMNSRSDSEFQLTGYLRVDGEKVYIRLLESGADDKLLYNFALSIDKGCTFYPLAPWGDIPQSFYARCAYVDTFESAGNEFTKYVMDIYEDSDWSKNNYFGKSVWIYGIGCEDGLLNLTSDLYYNFTPLQKVVSQGQVVYAIDNTSVETIGLDEEYGTSVKYRPDGTVFNDGDKGMYIYKGKKYIRN